MNSRDMAAMWVESHTGKGMQKAGSDLEGENLEGENGENSRERMLSLCRVHHGLQMTRLPCPPWAAACARRGCEDRKCLQLHVRVVRVRCVQLALGGTLFFFHVPCPDPRRCAAIERLMKDNGGSH